MKPNMGTLDRALRVLVAIVIAVLYYVGTISGTTAVVLGALAVVFVITSATSRCPLYVPLNISTRSEP